LRFGRERWSVGGQRQRPPAYAGGRFNCSPREKSEVESETDRDFVEGGVQLDIR
jgi:hypothetical protein